MKRQFADEIEDHVVSAESSHSRGGLRLAVDWGVAWRRSDTADEGCKRCRCCGRRDEASLTRYRMQEKLAIGDDF
jgi:hypothetical protein